MLLVVHWNEPIQGATIAENVKLQRSNLFQVGAAKNVGDVFLGDGFPNVQTHQDVAGMNSLLGGRALSVYFRDPQTATVSGAILQELAGGN